MFCNGDPLDMDFRKRIIDTFINAVYLYDYKVVMTYNVKGGKQMSYIDILDEGLEEYVDGEDTESSECKAAKSGSSSLQLGGKRM